MALRSSDCLCKDGYSKSWASVSIQLASRGNGRLPRCRRRLGHFDFIVGNKYTLALGKN